MTTTLEATTFETRTAADDRNETLTTDYIGELETFAEEAFACSGECAGSEGWYHELHATIAEVAESSDIDQRTLTAVFAFLSTNTGIDLNVALWRKWVDGVPFGHFSDVLRRIELVEEDRFEEAFEYKNGHKIESFDDNILYPNDSERVTCDRHAIRIVQGGDRCGKCAVNVLASKHGYSNVQRAYQYVADVLGMVPSELQARTWCHLVYCLDGAFGVCDHHDR